METKTKTIDELLEEVFVEADQDSFRKVETKIEDDEFFKLSLEERLDLLPF